MQLTKYKLGDLIVQRREKNKNFDVPIRGVSKEGFIKPKQQEADTSIYNVFYRNDFVFNPARMELNSIALNLEFDKALCSSLYEVFYVKDESIVLPEYLNLHIKREEFARYCDYIGLGSAREYCRFANISGYEIYLPSIDKQQEIVEADRLIKRRIHLNEQMIQHLEATAQALYRKMFVDNIDKDNLPNGWRIGKIEEICEVRDGTHDSPKPVEYGFPLVTSAHLSAWSILLDQAYCISIKDYNKINERSLVETSDILFSMIGTIGTISFVLYETIDFVVKNMAIFKTSHNPQYAEYVLCFLKSQDMNSYIVGSTNGSTQNYVTLSILRDTPIIIPNISLIELFHNNTSKIVSHIWSITKENLKLTELQSLLLAKMGQ